MITYGELFAVWFVGMGVYISYLRSEYGVIFVQGFYSLLWYMMLPMAT
jgi:hypothetical protein